ncbi:MAG: hypothetical protein ACI9S8_002372 [Chlamydiales bacterium]|jgi:hypothetical protein
MVSFTSNSSPEESQSADFKSLIKRKDSPANKNNLNRLIKAADSPKKNREEAVSCLVQKVLTLKDDDKQLIVGYLKESAGACLGKGRMNKSQKKLDARINTLSKCLLEFEKDNQNVPLDLKKSAELCRETHLLKQLDLDIHPDLKDYLFDIELKSNSAEEVHQKLKKYVIELIEEEGKPNRKSTVQLVHFNNATNLFTQSGQELPPRLQQAFTQVSKELGEIHQVQSSKKVPSRARRDNHRTPTEVATHFLARLDTLSKSDDLNPMQIERIKKLEKDVKKLILKHQLTVPNMKMFLIKAQAIGQDDFLGEKIDSLCTVLIGQLPEGDTAEPTRLHDNIYGRIFDTAMVEELIHNPPPSVSESMSKACGALLDHLEKVERGNLTPFSIDPGVIEARSPDAREGYTKELALELHQKFKKDYRLWEPNTGVKFQAFLEAKTPEDIEETFKDCLKPYDKSGFDSVASSCLLIKASIAMQSKENCPWMFTAGENYRKVVPLKYGDASIKGGVEESEGAGIGLAYQTVGSRPRGRRSSTRPVNMSRPDLKNIETKRVLHKALEHGLPWATGVSGSTNIALHALDHFNKEGADIDPKGFLLGTLMFLNHDGGHSVHEVLWTANQIDQSLNFGYELDPSQDEDEEVEEVKVSRDASEFVSDYETFRESFGAGDLRESEAIDEALDAGFEKTIEYFRDNSYYSSSDSGGDSDIGSLET